MDKNRQISWTIGSNPLLMPVADKWIDLYLEHAGPGLELRAMQDTLDVGPNGERITFHVDPGKARLYDCKNNERYRYSRLAGGHEIVPELRRLALSGNRVFVYQDGRLGWGGEVESVVWDGASNAIRMCVFVPNKREPEVMGEPPGSRSRGPKMDEDRDDKEPSKPRLDDDEKHA